MLSTLFSGTPTVATSDATSTHITDPSKISRSSSAFEREAFCAVLRNKGMLGVAEVHQCSHARGDGFLKLLDGTWVMLEIKETLYFGSMCAAFFECIAAQHLCQVPTDRGLIIFRRFGSDWIRAGRKKVQPAPWRLFDRHVNEFGHKFRFDALQLSVEGGRDHFESRPPAALLPAL